MDVPAIGDSARTLIVALDGTSNDFMKTVNDNFEKTLIGVMSTIDGQYPHWFNNFVGVVFRDAESIKANPAVPSTSKVFSSKNYTEFAHMLAVLQTNSLF